MQIIPQVIPFKYPSPFIPLIEGDRGRIFRRLFSPGLFYNPHVLYC